MKLLNEMTKRTLIAALLMLIGTMLANAQDGGYWRSASKTANAITGDITISSARLTIDFSSFPLASIRKLKPVEVSAIFDADVNAGIEGALYRIHVPAERRFLHKNTLCGSEETQWMATYVTGRTLEVAFFSGDNAPVFTYEAISNSTALCGTFTYAR